jgi:hypothetical protein
MLFYEKQRYRYYVRVMPFLVITLTLFAKSPIDTTTSLTGNAAVAAQPYPYLQPFPSTSTSTQTGQMQIQQPSQQSSNLNVPNSVTIGNSNNNNNNPFQNLQNQIDQLKAIISNLHGQKLVVTETFAPDSTGRNGQSKAVCNSDDVVTGGGWITPERVGFLNQEILKNQASGNGWIVEIYQGPPLKAVAECAKLS